jgi:hypothetical protein
MRSRKNEINKIRNTKEEDDNKHHGNPVNHQQLL